MSKKSIVTILLIILIGMMITDFNINGVGVFELFFHRLKTESMEEFHIGGGSLGGSQKEFSVDDNMSFKADNMESLNINNSMGSVKLIGEDRDSIEVDYTITVYARTVERAEEFAKQLEVNKAGESNIEFSIDKPDNRKGIQAIKVAYNIRAPQYIIPEIKNKYGRMEVSNFINGAKLSNAYEKTEIRDLAGRVKIESKYGDLNVNNIDGEAEIEVAYNDAVISNIGKDLDLEARYCDVELQDVKGSLLFDTNYGEASLENVHQTDIKSDYTEIDISGIKGELTADMDYGELNVEEINHSMDVRGRYTDIGVELASQLKDYRLDCETEYGDIDTNFPVSYKEDDNEVRVTKKAGTGEVELEIVTDHADIEIDQ